MEEEKEILVKLFLTLRKMIKTENDSDAENLAREAVDNIVKIQEEM